MSTSASPPRASTVEYVEHLSHQIAVPSITDEHQIFLGPVSNPDPTEFINGETNRIPFRFANPDLSLWKNTFKSWPSAEKSWPAWYMRMSASKLTHWEEIGISQALALTVADMAKEEPMMVAATYFWSTAMNAFLFSQGPMTPTLLDIKMITGLDITSSANLASLNTKSTHEFKTRSICGWTGYAAKNMVTGSISTREHVAFLMMWLEKFLFCGPSCGPTANWQHIAENLVEKKQFPHGKYLLGYLYQTLNSAITKMASRLSIGTGGPWWLLQIWLILHTIMVADQPLLTNARFPRFEPIIGEDGENITTCRCMSFGEATSEINSEKYEKSREVYSRASSPCILAVGIHQGKNIQMTYEFYHPTSVARQLGMGQQPISLFFADKIQSRGEITSALMMDRLLNIPGPPLGSIDNIKLRMLRSAASNRCFNVYDRSIPEAVPQPTESCPPHHSNSGVEILYALGLLPNSGGLAPPVIGYHTPKTSTLLHDLPRVPIALDAGRKKRAKSAGAPSAAKKKPRKQKATADVLPAIDLDVAEFLEGEELAEDVDEAAEHDSDTREQTPPADPLVPQRTPSPPVRPTYKPRVCISSQSMV
uniref:Aminotransferase-like plant mobile domain-containing protein n=1 Tax=Oryza sativa subsp. japonica TaxID=39947 RepID=Q10IL1_ORYSJ|nr:hypothetical protein LOC_Os03g33870 [Oryza sativa Japonica Group]